MLTPEPSDAEVAFTVRDAGSGQALLTGSAVASRDAVTTVGVIEAPLVQALLTLDWSTDGGPGRSHYLAGSPPFPLEWYLASMERAGL